MFLCSTSDEFVLCFSKDPIYCYFWTEVFELVLEIKGSSCESQLDMSTSSTNVDVVSAADVYDLFVPCLFLFKSDIIIFVCRFSSSITLRLLSENLLRCM